MHLVQIILPLRSNAGEKLPRALFDDTQQELARRFGGVTAFTRSPAEGLWETQRALKEDDVVLYEVMADALDRDWWEVYRARLEARFGQKEIVVRAHEMERL
jgi:hypothetical protein